MIQAKCRGGDKRVEGATWLYVGWKEVLMEKVTSGSRTEWSERVTFAHQHPGGKNYIRKGWQWERPEKGVYWCIQGAQGGWRKSLRDQIWEMARSRPQRTWGEQAKAQVLTLGGDRSLPKDLRRGRDGLICDLIGSPWRLLEMKGGKNRSRETW